MGAAGRAAVFTGVTTPYYQRKVLPYGVAPQKFTVVVVFDWLSGGSNSYPQLLGLDSANTAWIVGSVASSGGDITVIKGGVAVVGSGLPLTSGKTYVYVASHRTDTGEFYGLLRPLDSAAYTRDSGTNTSPANVTIDGVAAIGAGRRDLAAGWNGSVYAAVAFTEFFPEVLGRQILANPWQLFEPRRAVLPASAAGPAPFPTLSNARMDPITSTGGVPKVDYAF
jgi:hypothetical protein